ncbi:signal peptidase II [Herminiimonas arsenitoxidans]|jgi:signal peptidase II|uniref:signal peptidase II n=1 Tax=Herminiimonas arsenitoxidans TaxID=1809410 RepID=UPI0009711DD7|nr:signal peptidase II [Herminiimonas arsenitoxidans]
MATKKHTTYSSPSSIVPWLGIATIVLLIDQITKLTILRLFSYGESHAVTSFFNLVLVYNKGAAFSFLASETGWQRYFFTIVGVAASIFIIYLLKKHSGQRLFSWALSLILGGAIGNVIDRFLYGHVVDFLDVHVAGWHWPAFNVADSAICIGAVLFIYDELRRVGK